MWADDLIVSPNFDAEVVPRRSASACSPFPAIFTPTEVSPR
jgi:2-keto-3-deoxy-6-phosphogluconate aldolase